MPINVDVQKSRGGIFWTNRYQFDFATIGELPLPYITALEALEKPLHSTAVNFVSARVSDGVPGSDEFYIIPLTGTGGTSDGGTPVPGYNTLRVDWASGVGRPCRKYYRVYVGEAQTVGQSWLTEYLTDCNTLAVAFIGDCPEFCDPQGNHISLVAVKSLIQMRQLRRGSRRRTEPVIPIA